MFAQVYERVAQQLRRHARRLHADDATGRRARRANCTIRTARICRPSCLSRLSERTSGRYAGVGAQVDVRDGWITIVAPLPGGPALDAGIQTGDRVVTVDGKPMHGVQLDEAQKALRGEPGSTVRLTVERPGVAAPIEFTLTRREIHVRSVQHAMLLRDGVGYVALSIFSQESAARSSRPRSIRCVAPE